MRGVKMNNRCAYCEQNKIVNWRTTNGNYFLKIHRKCLMALLEKAGEKTKL